MTIAWKARWLQDPRFDGLQPIDTLYRWRERDGEVRRIFAQHQPGLSNVHMLLRKTFNLEAAPASAQLWITADDYYKLWINGRFVGQGPAPAYYWNYYYNTWDIAPYLHAGQNVVAAHVYYQGLITRVWNSLDHRMGMLAETKVELTDGRQINMLSDASWRYHIIGKPTNVTLEDHLRRKSPEAYYKPSHSGGMIGSLTQFQENVDERTHPAGWRQPGFDDSHWAAPSAVDVASKDYNFVPQPTPPLEFHQVQPQAIQKRGEGRYLLDFGRQVVGSLGMRQPGRDGHAVEIRHAEELTPEGDARYQMRCNCNYQEYWTLSNRDECTLEYFDYKSFRYVEVLNPTQPPTADSTWVTEQHYPWPGTSRFESSLPLLDRIWHICAEAVRLGCQEMYTDCPHREKGQYLGDMVMTGHTHALLTGDTRLLRKAISQFAQSARISPGLKSIVPGNFMNELADYSLQFPMQVEFYYWQTGDLAFVEEMLPAAEGMLDYFRRYENEDGLLSDVADLINFVDHTPFTDDYDFSLGRKGEALGQGPHAVLNAYYYGAKCSLSRLRSLLGRQPIETDALQQAFLRAFYLPDRMLFIDAFGSGHSSLHTNSLALYYELVPEQAREGVIGLLREKRMACSPYMAYYLLHALYRASAADLAFDLITCRDPNSWHSMLEAGATTAMEVWTVDLKRNISFCHPWSSAPIPVIVEHLMGLQPLRPGWDGVQFAPQTPAYLDWATLTIPIPQGTVYVSFSKQGDLIRYELSLPPGVALHPAETSGLALIEENGETGKYVLERGGG